MSRLLALVAIAGAILLGLEFVPQSGASSSSLPAVKHVFLIVLENEDEATTFGAASPAPYLAKTLVSEGALIPNYYSIGHNSLDNYIAMISGQAPDVATQNDCGTFSSFVASSPSLDSDGQAVGSGCVYPSASPAVPTLPGQLDAAGLTWKGYMDSMGADPARESATCGHPAIGAADNTQAETATDQYATRHDPFMYFHSIIDDPAYCDSHVVNLSMLASDLSSVASTPNFSFITPGLCNDGHNTNCANGDPGGLPQINTFLPGLISEIEASPAYRADGLIIVTFDEADSGGDDSSCCDEQAGPNAPDPGDPTDTTAADTGGGKIGAVLLSPFIKPGTVTQTAYNHYSLLRTVEDLFGLPHIGFAAQAGLASFGADVFTNNTSSTTTTSSTTAPGCAAQRSGPVLGSVSVVKTHAGHSLSFVPRRNGVLSFQIRPAHGSAHKLQHETLRACRRVTLSLPAGAGHVQLTATAGSAKQTETRVY
jgi:phosphatidylinositol-3-phosphatase